MSTMPASVITAGGPGSTSQESNRRGRGNNRGRSTDCPGIRWMRMPCGGSGAKVYNGANHPERGDSTLPAFAYQPGQALFDKEDPASCIGRSASPMMQAEQPAEREGQVDNVWFHRVWCCSRTDWFLYYGRADSRIGCATATAR